MSCTFCKKAALQEILFGSLHAKLIGVQMEEDFIMANPEWVKELEIMTRTKVKAEIQALSSFGFQYLSEVYLPLKLQEGDWI